MAEPERSDDPVDDEDSPKGDDGSEGVAESAVAAPPSSSIIGRVVDERYRVERPIARGGMGVVCEAIHVSTGRTVALKLLSTREHKPVEGLEPDSNSLERSREITQRFHREARAAAALDTKHIVQILDTGTDQATREPYIVMELLRGEDLKVLLERVRVLPPDVAARVVVQACRALIKAHEAGIVHRDIKPGNLFLAEMDDGEIVVKLLDFGIAKIKLHVEKDREQTDLTRTGSILGSPHYMSPEQAQGLKTIDARADIWSLGVVLYKMLSGRTPHQGAESTGQLLVLICTEEPDPLEGIAPWAPRWLIDIVDRALQRRPDARYTSIQQMHDELLAGLGASPTIHRGELVPLSEEQRAQSRRAPRLPAAVTTTLPSARHDDEEETAVSPDDIGTQLTGSIPPGATPLAGHRRRTRWLAGALGALVLVALAIMAWQGLQRQAADPEVAAEPASTAGATTSPTTAAKTVRLAIVPADAQVTVDGRELEVRDGQVELSAAVGSAIGVTVRSGEQSVEVTVAITDHGAVPDRVQLPEPAPRAAASAAAETGAPPVRRPTAGGAKRRPAAGGKPPASRPTSVPSASPSAPASSGKWGDQLAPSESLD